MSRKYKQTPIYTVSLKSPRGSESFETITIRNNLENRELSEDCIKSRGCKYFGNLADVKESLNWNFNKDTDKCQIRWLQSTKHFSFLQVEMFD